ncbi:nicotinate phosphoribosyltransferase [Rhodotorula toruloides]|uniref:Nicotinate phosphoribosyltransferase n=1 Tax=Rhodotorula toruloides TaxID=5286 RepID=A0A511KH91_RHOTO|nr:nicotinate phosphoribosyltransferase [Rhodotorula toruloides]
MANASPPPESYIQSLLDVDLYKLSMQYAVLETYPDVSVKYRFTNRSGTKFTRTMYDAVLAAIKHLETLRLQPEERAFLERRCPYFPKSYLDYLSNFRLRPDEQVKVDFVPNGERLVDGTEWGGFDLEIHGLWMETILYEVPLMSIISEAYFTHVDTKWDYVGQFENARQKGLALYRGGCILSEFGSRRRRTYKAHDIIMRGLIKANEECGNGKEGKGGKLSGTSNVHFAQKYNLVPIGTIAHELIMGIAALEGYEGSNGRMMDMWRRCVPIYHAKQSKSRMDNPRSQIYPDGSLGIALTDTFTTKPFFNDFVSNPQRARRWKGLRQDSGDPFKFIPIAKEAFERVGADPSKKVVVFSDSLDVKRCLELKKASDEAGIGCSFGVGTDLTNDFRHVEQPEQQEHLGDGPIRTVGEKSKALNMVIKLYSINDQFCVKISDELTKVSIGAVQLHFSRALPTRATLKLSRLVKRRFGLEDHGAESDAAKWGPIV